MKNELVVEVSPKSVISEAIKTVRTNIQFASPDKEVKTIHVTSSIAGEGKSFISSNLAVAYAKIGKKVLIVDTDMRRGRLHKLFKVNGERGLSNLLIENEADAYTHYIQKTKIDNLHVITRGIIPPNPSELLDSKNNKKLIEKLRETYDIVIFDGVPVNGLTDSLITATLTDITVIVSSINLTPLELLKHTQKTLSNIDCLVGGIIVNRVEHKDKYYNYYYQS